MTEKEILQRQFYARLSRLSRNGWERMNKPAANDLVDLGVRAGLLDKKRAPELAMKLQFGEVFLREDGQWACTTCGGNCGQCGDTGFYGNIGFSMDHLAKVVTPGSQSPLPRYVTKTVLQWELILLGVACIIAILVLL